MTIPATEPFFSGPYPGNGATVQFDYDFRIYSDDELLVYRRNADLTRTLLDEGTDYAVTGAGASGGGYITLASPTLLPTGASLTIEPNITPSQDRPFSSQTSIDFAEMGISFDKLTSLLRQSLGLLLRSVKVPAGQVAGDLLAGTPGKVVMFDDEGNLTAGPDVSEIADAAGSADAAAASVVAAAAEADAAVASAEAAALSVVQANAAVASAQAAAAAAASVTVVDIPTMLADPRSIAAGTVIVTRGEHMAFTVMASGSSDFDQITAGGVKLKVHPANAVVVPLAFGVNGVASVGELSVVGSAGIPDDTAKIQRMVDFVMANGATLVMPTDRDYGISSTIYIRPVANRNTGFSGASGSQHFANQPSFDWINSGNSRIVALAAMDAMVEVIAATGGITSVRACWMYLSKVRLDGNGLASKCVKTDWSYRNKYHAVRTTGAQYGFYIDHDAGSEWLGCEFNCTVAGLHANYAGDWTIIGGDCWVTQAGFSLGGGSNSRISGVTFTGVDNGDTTTVCKCVTLKIATAENPVSGNRSRSVKVFACESAGCDWLVYGDDTDGDGNAEIWNVNITDNHLVRTTRRPNAGIAYLRNANSVSLSGNQHGDYQGATGAGPSVRFENVNAFSIRDMFNNIVGDAIYAINCNGGVISGSVFQDCGVNAFARIVRLDTCAEVAVVGNSVRWSIGVTPAPSAQFGHEVAGNRNRFANNAIDTTKMVRPYTRAGAQTKMEHEYFGEDAFAGATINAGAELGINVNVVGARIGDFSQASTSFSRQNLLTDTRINAADLVRVVLRNPTGAAITIPAGTITAVAISR